MMMMTNNNNELFENSVFLTPYRFLQHQVPGYSYQLVHCKILLSHIPAGLTLSL